MNRGPGLGSLPVELFYKVQLFALSDTLPQCQHIHRVFKSAPPSFHAEYILSRVFPDRADRIVTRALRYPLCTMEVLNALCRYIGGTCSFSELPQRLFRDLPVRRSERTEDDHPLPFLKHLYNHPSIKAPAIAFDCYALRKAGQACSLPLIYFLLTYTSEELTPLSWAAGEGFEEVVKLLLARDDIDVNLTDKWGRPPLSWAVGREHVGVVRQLLARDDINVNLEDSLGRTPLFFATNSRLTGVAKLLLARDDINVNSTDGQGRTPLSWAAGEGMEEVVKLLLAQDIIEVNSGDGEGMTPLSWAAMFGHEQVVKLLLARDDIDVNSRDGQGRTALSWATMHGFEEAVKLLLARDDIDANSSAGHHGTFM